MDEIKTQAIVLRSVIYKENDKILTLFSLNNGKMTAGIKGVLKAKAKLAYAGMPFCFGEFRLVQRGGFYTVVGCESDDLFFDITKDLERFYYGAIMLEICDILVKENEPNAPLFINLLKALKLLAYDNCDAVSVIIKFVIDALKFSGYRVQIDKCVKCVEKGLYNPYFSFDLGGVVCGVCASREPRDNLLKLSQGEYAILKIIDECEISKLTTLKFASKDNLFSCLKLLISFFTQKTDCKIKSVEQLFKII